MDKLADLYVCQAEYHYTAPEEEKKYYKDSVIAEMGNEIFQKLVSIKSESKSDLNRFLINISENIRVIDSRAGIENYKMYCGFRVVNLNECVVDVPKPIKTLKEQISEISFWNRFKLLFLKG